MNISQKSQTALDCNAISCVESIFVALIPEIKNAASCRLTKLREKAGSVPRKNGFLNVFSYSALASFLFLPFGLAAQVAPHLDIVKSKYSIEVWQTENGLPENSVTAVLQSRDGYLWFGTLDGLVRFDGVNFKVFNAANTSKLRSSRITALFEDDAGAIWIGQETGELTRLKNGEFINVDFDPAWDGGMIVSIATDERQDLWVMGEKQMLVRVRDKLCFRSDWDPNLSNSPPGGPSLVRDALNRLWQIRSGQVNLVCSNSLAPISFGSPDDRASLAMVCGSRDGGLWVVGNGHVRKWKDNHWVRDLGGYDWGNSYITCLRETISGDLLVGTINQGLFVLDASGEKLCINRSNGLPQDWVRCLTEDREGNVWVGTSGGLVVLRPRRVVMLAPPDFFQGNRVLGLAPGKDGSIWAGTEGVGLDRLRAGAWTSFGPEQGFQKRWVLSVLEDSSGRVWAGSWGIGLCVSEGDRFSIPPVLASLTAPVAALAESPPGTLWIGTGGGLMRFTDDKLESFAGLGGPAAAVVRAICCESNGPTWFGTAGAGLGRLQGRTLTRFTKSDGLASQFILSLHLDKDGTLWIGTLENGLCRFKDGQFSTVSTKQGLPNNSISQILDDEKGNLWLGTQRGICRASKQQLQRCANGSALSVDCVVYGREEGLTSLSCSSGFQPNCFESQDGRLYFPTAKGIAEVKSDDTRFNSILPPVLLEDVLVQGRLATLKSGTRQKLSPPGATLEPPSIEVPPGHMQIDIHFTGISFTAPGRMRFRYRLEGLESDWRETQGRSANYAFLPPGNYLFHVMACNSDGLWNQEGASLAITVLPQLWQTWWFKTFAGSFVIGAVGGGVFYVSRRRMHRKIEIVARERAIERERARIAQDIHDDLGASLTRITMLSQTVRSELDNPAKFATGVDQIYTTARELTRSMDEIVWATSPRHDTLESLMTYVGRYAQGFLSAAGIRCRLDEPPTLPAWGLTSEIRHNVFLAVKEALNNAVKHAGATEVSILMELKPSVFVLVVADNGCGFQWDPQNACLSSAPGDSRLAEGNGLTNIQKRLQAIGGFSVIDTTPGKGTQIKLVVKI